MCSNKNLPNIRFKPISLRYFLKIKNQIIKERASTNANKSQLHASGMLEDTTENGEKTLADYFKVLKAGAISRSKNIDESENSHTKTKHVNVHKRSKSPSYEKNKKLKKTEFTEKKFKNNERSNNDKKKRHSLMKSSNDGNEHSEYLEEQRPETPRPSINHEEMRIMRDGNSESRLKNKKQESEKQSFETNIITPITNVEKFQQRGTNKHELLRRNKGKKSLKSSPNKEQSSTDKIKIVNTCDKQVQYSVTQDGEKEATNSKQMTSSGDSVMNSKVIYIDKDCEMIKIILPRTNGKKFQQRGTNTHVRLRRNKEKESLKSSPNKEQSSTDKIVNTCDKQVQYSVTQDGEKEATNSKQMTSSGDSVRKLTYEDKDYERTRYEGTSPNHKGINKKLSQVRFRDNISGDQNNQLVNHENRRSYKSHNKYLCESSINNVATNVWDSNSLHSIVKNEFTVAKELKKDLSNVKPVKLSNDFVELSAKSVTCQCGVNAYNRCSRCKKTFCTSLICTHQHPCKSHGAVFEAVED